jgi:hypothetical protein
VELGGGLSIRLPRQTKPKLENVTPAQFIAANARIMATLIESGRLADTEVLDYLAYTAKVGEMATRYTWGSVLLYDDHYRQENIGRKTKPGLPRTLLHGAKLLVLHRDWLYSPSVFTHSLIPSIDLVVGET